MDTDNKLRKVLYVLIIMPFSAMSDDNNVCFYLNDNYIEREKDDKFCVPYYTEGAWLHSKWNEGIASIKVPSNMRVDIFKGLAFTGTSVSLYQDTNTAGLDKYGFRNNISSYRVLPKNLYPDDKRVIFSYHSEFFSEKYFGYSYYVTRGHDILLGKYHQHINADGQSGSVFYSHAGQIMTAFAGQGVDRNLYCLSPTSRRDNGLNIDVAFSYCDFNNPGQNWFPDKITDKVVLVNRRTGTALSLDDVGFYVALNQNDENTRVMNKNILWFDEDKIEELKEHSVRPFLQYKESLEAMNEESQRKVIVHHLDKPDDMYIYLDDKNNGRYVYYNAETKYLIAYNDLDVENKKIKSACLSLLNDGSSQHSPISFIYHQSNYSNNDFYYGCDNGVAYNFYTKKWHFMAEWEYLYLVNGHENKVLNFYINDNPQYNNSSGILTGPKIGTHIGRAVNFNERRPQDAVYISNPSLVYVFDVEKGICELNGFTDDNGTYCPEFSASWSSTDKNVQRTYLSHYYIPWILTKISHELTTGNRDEVLHAFMEKVEALTRVFEQQKHRPIDDATLWQTKALLVELLSTYSSIQYEQLWHQVAYILNRVEVSLERRNN
jgi:hypothetical protein